MKTIAPKPTFWITNMSSRNVTLADLALNIKAFSTINLLDKKHYSYTLQQLLKSKESGSLFAKKELIAVRNVPPPNQKRAEVPISREAVIPTRSHSIFQIENKEYDELKVEDKDHNKQDEIYAMENADLADLDRQRSIINSKKE